MPFFVTVFLANGFVVATPLIVRRISVDLMVAAAPAIVSGSARALRVVVNTFGVQGRARIGVLKTSESIGRRTMQATAAVRRQFFSHIIAKGRIRVDLPVFPDEVHPTMDMVIRRIPVWTPAPLRIGGQRSYWFYRPRYRRGCDTRQSFRALVPVRKLIQMPNVKIYVNEDIFAAQRTAFAQILLPLRDIVAKHLNVPHSACQFALLPVAALTDQPSVNVEMHIMPRADRTQETIAAMGIEIQNGLRDVTGSSVAFRCAQLDPETYVALK